MNARSTEMLSLARIERSFTVMIVSIDGRQKNSLSLFVVAQQNRRYASQLGFNPTYQCNFSL